jgi:hypothetical protein
MLNDRGVRASRVSVDVSVELVRAALRPRNPRLQDAHTGRKRRLKPYTINRDSGISGTGRTATVPRVPLKSR